MQLAIFSKWSYPRGVLLSRPDVVSEGVCVVVSEAFLNGSVDVLPFCSPEFPSALFLELTKGRPVVLRPYLLTYAHRSQWSIGHQRPPAIAVCSGPLLSFRTSWSPAVSALLQCVASRRAVLRPGSLKHPLLSFDHPPEWGS